MYVDEVVGKVKALADKIGIKTIVAVVVAFLVGAILF